MNPSKRIGVIYYNCGNVFNIVKTFKTLGYHDVEIIQSGSIEPYDTIVLPGVGSFQNAISSLRDAHLDQGIGTHIKSRKKVLGICLGMQLLMNSSNESGSSIGLSVFSGNVRRMNRTNNKKKLPHVGINEVKVEGKTLGEFYFSHSYAVDFKDKEAKDVTLGFSHYIDQDFVSYVQKNEIVGTQFHPELSGKAGLEFLSSFLKGSSNEL